MIVVVNTVTKLVVLEDSYKGLGLSRMILNRVLSSTSLIVIEIQTLLRIILNSDVIPY